MSLLRGFWAFPPHSVGRAAHAERPQAILSHGGEVGGLLWAGGELGTGGRAALLTGVGPPPATTEGTPAGMESKGDSFIGSPVTTASPTPPPLSRC